mgnify:CR=1 FL=1
MGENGSVEELFVQGHAKVAGDAAPASSAPAAVSTAFSVEEVSAMDGYDYLNDYCLLYTSDAADE